MLFGPIEKAETSIVGIDKLTFVLDKTCSKVSPVKHFVNTLGMNLKKYVSSSGYRLK